MATAAARPENASSESVAVRMYRGILGDCFLLTHVYQGQVYRALIDCGVLQCIGSSGSKPKTKEGTERIVDVVRDLHASTGGKLDLVIATHEHYDHLSGFILAHDLFKQFEIGALWTAWTEDRKDPLANEIRAKRSKGLEALAALVQPGTRDRPSALVPMPNLSRANKKQKEALEEARERITDRIKTIADLLQFYGEVEPWEPDLAAAKRERPPYDPEKKPRSCENVLQWLAHRVGEDKVTPLEPGMQVRFGVEGRLTANVLGPPRLRSRLLKMDPTKGASEVYLVAQDDVTALSSTLKFQADDGAGSRPTRAPVEELPFASRFLDRPDLSESPASKDIRKLYEDPQSASRRIDGEWTASAEALALKIDGDVNNTSLALAIEVEGGDVLLFPADAQVGNWLSWHDQKYPAKRETRETKQKSAADLLARVILYKVGHHGSHNATAREQGLELMTSPELVAMIPVVEAVAREQKTTSNPDGWDMPYDKLDKRLKERTGGRIVQGDGDPDAEQRAFAASRFELSYGPQPDPLWVELTRRL